MFVNGISELLSSQSTREVPLSCGISLQFSKLRWKDYASKEIYITQQRGNVAEKAKKVAEAIGVLGEDDFKKEIAEALKEIVLRGNYAHFDEYIVFEESPMGKAYDLFMCTHHETAAIKEPADAYILLESTSLTEEDRAEIEKGIYWSKELPALKNVVGPSQLELFQNENL